MLGLGRELGGVGWRAHLGATGEQFGGCRSSGSSEAVFKGAGRGVRDLQRCRQEPQALDRHRQQLQGRNGKSGGITGDSRGAVGATGPLGEHWGVRGL